MKKLIFTFIFTSVFAIPAVAQDADLTEDEKEIISSRIIDKLDDFQFFLQIMADKRSSQPVRQDALDSNKVLFIGNCEPYDEYNEFGEYATKHPAVRMQTSSVTRKRVYKPQLMKTYFNRIMSGLGYSNIKIEQSDAVRIDNYRKLADGKYIAMARIVQYFTGYGEGGAIRYKDLTEKKVMVHIDLIEVPTTDGIEEFWDVKLGDIYVLSTTKI